MDYILESFIDYCDNMMIAEEKQSLDMLLTTNPFKKNVILYHGSSYQDKQSTINPDGYCAGNRFTRPSMASFWAPTFEYAKLFGLFRLIDKCLGYKANFAGDAYHIYVKPSEYENIEREVQDKVIWVYEKDISKDYITRGHARYIEEFTIDVPVKPDKAYRLEYTDFKELFYDTVITFPSDDKEEIKKFLEKETAKMIKSDKYPKNLIKLFTHYNLSTTLSKVKELRSLAKENYTLNDGYYRVTYNDIGIYEALKNNINKNEWFSILKSNKISWLPKPPEYASNNRSYFTEKGYKMFKQKSLPLIINYLNPSGIKIEKVELSDKIIYMDEYQVVVNSKSLAKESYTENSNNMKFVFNKKFDDVKKIVDTLDIKELKRILGRGKIYRDSPSCIYREVACLGNIPISFIELHDSGKNDNSAYIVIATNPKYRGIGASKHLIRRMKKCTDRKLIWSTQKDNPASLHLAKKYGFEPVFEAYITSGKYNYIKISSSKDIKNFQKCMQVVFHTKEDMSEKDICKSMKAIKCNNEIIGYIGFSYYDIDNKKYLGIGNFMIKPEYQNSGHGTKVIHDIIERNKSKYDEIYCYVDKENKTALNFYKKIAKVNTKNLTDNGYYVRLYKK